MMFKFLLIIFFLVSSIVAKFPVPLNISTLSNNMGKWKCPIPYQINYKTKFIDRIHDAIKHIEETTGWSFVEQDREDDYLNFTDSDKCSAHLGKLGGKQNVNVFQLCDVGAIINQISLSIGYDRGQTRNTINEIDSEKLNSLVDGKLCKENVDLPCSSVSRTLLLDFPSLYSQEYLPVGEYNDRLYYRTKWKFVNNNYNSNEYKYGYLYFFYGHQDGADYDQWFIADILGTSDDTYYRSISDSSVREPLYADFERNIIITSNECRGLRGIPGIRGEQGLKGDMGEQGIQGEMGEQGLKGDMGEQGIRGEMGEQGLKGNMGEQGLKGDIGDQGIQGENGEQGIQGERGEQGLKGNIGDQGIQGENGEQGIQGERGEQGDIQGLKGDTGEQGIQGERGEQGIRGKKGDMGKMGERGSCSKIDSIKGILISLCVLNILR